MVKKISCRVISSVPLGTSADPLCNHHGPNRAGDFVAEDVRVNHTSKSADRTGWPNTAKALVDDGLTGCIFDCYA